MSLQALYIIQSAMATPWSLYIAWCLGAKRYKLFWLSLLLWLVNDIIYSVVFLALLGVR